MSTVVRMGMPALAAGACTIAAARMEFAKQQIVAALNGLALSALGLIWKELPA